jgi:hypothetical protein
MLLSTLAESSLICQTEFPAHAELEQQLRFILNYAVLAPSGHNTQPWLFRLSGEQIELYCDRARSLPVADPHEREMIISCGAALFYLRVALAHHGFDHELKTLPDPGLPELLARIRITGRREETVEERTLFNAIPLRRTCRLPFSGVAVQQSVQSGLRRAALREGAWLHIIRGGPARIAAADLIAEGDRIQLRDKRYRQELAEWVRAADAPGHDGIPPQALGMPSWAESVDGLVRFALRAFNTSLIRARQDRRLALASPVLAVLGTATDTRGDWLSAGQALARVLLRAAAVGLSASFLNQPIEVLSLRGTLQDLVGGRGYPQLLLRLGYGQPTAPTPRRSTRDVLLHR